MHTRVLAVVIMLLVPSLSAAQGTTSRVAGTVTDKSGGIIPGASVTLTSDGTAIKLSTTTNDSGSYAFDSVQIGRYTLAVELQGFKLPRTRGYFVNLSLSKRTRPNVVALEVSVGKPKTGWFVTLVQQRDQRLAQDHAWRQVLLLTLSSFRLPASGFRLTAGSWELEAGCWISP